MLQTDVSRAHESRHEIVFETAQVKPDVVIEVAHGNLVQLFRDQTNILQIGGSVDLVDDTALDVVGQHLECFLCSYIHNHRAVFQWAHGLGGILLDGRIHVHEPGHPVLSSKQPKLRVRSDGDDAHALTVRSDAVSPFGKAMVASAGCVG